MHTGVHGVRAFGTGIETVDRIFVAAALPGDYGLARQVTLLSFKPEAENDFRM
jgi:hypothetical protein